MEDKVDLLNFTIPQLLRWRVQATGEKVALREKDFGYWNNCTWNDYYALVRKTALGLQKIGMEKDNLIHNKLLMFRIIRIWFRQLIWTMIKIMIL